MRSVLAAVVAATILSLLSGCFLDPGDYQGSDHDGNSAAFVPPEGPPPPGDGAAPQIGSGCYQHSTPTSTYCLGLKYVTYQNSSGMPIISSSGALNNLSTINQIWAQCKVQFQIDEFDVIDPRNYGLNFQSQTMNELDSARAAFDNNRDFLVLTTGTWTGSLGAGAANAWTNMPGGGGPWGAVLEQTVAFYPNIFAHELGHYLNLPHVNDLADVMNPVIYGNSTGLTESQCSAARAAAGYFWSAMLR